MPPPPLRAAFAPGLRRLLSMKPRWQAASGMAAPDHFSIHHRSGRALPLPVNVTCSCLLGSEGVLHAT